MHVQLYLKTMLQAKHKKDEKTPRDNASADLPVNAQHPTHLRISVSPRDPVTCKSKGGFRKNDSSCQVEAFSLDSAVQPRRTLPCVRPQKHCACICSEERKGKERKGKERKGMERKGKERKGKERKGKERKGKERKGKERKGKERKGKERKGLRCVLAT